jgi:hypothetical protein
MHKALGSISSTGKKNWHEDRHISVKEKSKSEKTNMHMIMVAFQMSGEKK